MVEQNLLTIYKNKVSISCYSEFHAITGNHQTTKELLTVAYCLLTSRRFLACAGRIRAVKFSREKPSTTTQQQLRHESLHRQHVHDIQGAVSKSQEIHRQPLVCN